MINLEEGGENMLPWVRVEITTGRWPFEYWYEVSYYDPDNKIEGEPAPCWVHDWERDGGAFGLWSVLRKAHTTMQECWFELTTIPHDHQH